MTRSGCWCLPSAPGRDTGATPAATFSTYTRFSLYANLGYRWRRLPACWTTAWTRAPLWAISWRRLRRGLLALLATLEAATEPQEHDLTNLIKETIAMKKHLTPEQLTKGAHRRATTHDPTYDRNAVGRDGQAARAGVCAAVPRSNACHGRPALDTSLRRRLTPVNRSPIGDGRAARRRAVCVGEDPP